MTGSMVRPILRRHFLRQAIRLALALGLLFAVVWVAFWWSGSAIRFGASQVEERAETTWRIIRTVRGWRNAEARSTGRRCRTGPQGWLASFFHTDANHSEVFELSRRRNPIFGCRRGGRSGISKPCPTDTLK